MTYSMKNDDSAGTKLYIKFKNDADNYNSKVKS